MITRIPSSVVGLAERVVVSLQFERGLFFSRTSKTSKRFPALPGKAHRHPPPNWVSAEWASFYPISEVVAWGPVSWSDHSQARNPGRWGAVGSSSRPLPQILGHVCWVPEVLTGFPTVGQCLGTWGQRGHPHSGLIVLGLQLGQRPAGSPVQSPWWGWVTVAFISWRFDILGPWWRWRDCPLPDLANS